MNFSLRKIALIISGAALVCFCSCERHHPDELAEPAKPNGEPAAAEHRAPGPVPTASPTPAQFFPESTPH